MADLGTLLARHEIFIDEFGINIAMTRTRARAPIGQRAEVVEPFKRGSNISVISALDRREWVHR